MKFFLLRTLAASLIASALSGCAIPFVVGGAFAGGVLMATDRRTTGTQIEDEGIELRASNRISDALGGNVHVNVTSYNRQVLLTGEVPTEKDKEEAEKIAAKTNNAKSVVNELGVLGNASFSARTSDAFITSRVKSALLEDKHTAGNAFKIVTERGVVYMMGIVTEREADAATAVVRTQSGVQKVVRVLDIISESDLKLLLPEPAPKLETKASPVMSGAGQPVTTVEPK